MQLTLDFGNSAVKAGVFQGKKLIHLERHKNLSDRTISMLFRKFEIKKAISCSVTLSSRQSEATVRSKTSLIQLRPSTILPIQNLYQSPKTLGMDRLANVIGAATHFPNKNILVVSAGTCITYDAITSGRKYFGGNITPGLDMRLRSMHTFTSRLPLLRKKTIKSLFGANTSDSMLTGAIKGAQLEMEGFISAYKKKYHSLKVIITGGDLSFFDGQLECRIFAVPHLVLHGLNEILLLNDSQKD